MLNAIKKNVAILLSPLHFGKSSLNSPAFIQPLFDNSRKKSQWKESSISETATSSTVGSGRVTQTGPDFALVWMGSILV